MEEGTGLEPLSFEYVAQAAIGPFLGVLLAFVLERLWSWGSDSRSRRSMLRGIKAELEQGQGRLNELLGKLLRTDNWNSAIYSGRTMLLNDSVRSRIGGTYFAIDNYNYEAKIVRQLNEQARQATSVDSTGHQTANLAMTTLAQIRWQQLVDSQKALAGSIASLLAEDFWKEDC